MTRRSRIGGSLTPEDVDLWAHVVDSVHPMRRVRRERRIAGNASHHSDPPAIEARPAGLATETVEPVPAMPDISHIAPPPRSKLRWQPLITNPTPRPKLPAATPQHFDRKQARKIATGKVEIEGRLDLHGMREHEAHMRLRGFLRQAHAQGRRTVLIITGKGRDGDAPDAPFDTDPDRQPRGVLKRNVPRWLADPDLAPLIVSYTTAHSRHGGEGALYVHLRRA